ncbi:MAG: cysteine synthase A [Bacteroidetes bacterium]|nr:cysteine synthase A [Bacteroidota bacterium]
MIIKDSLELIGNTPMLKAKSLKEKGSADIYVKLEKFSLTGSVKDRALLNMILQMEERGELKRGDIIVESTSGNTGIAMAAVCQKKGYKAIIVMPDSMSKERRDLISAYGAELVLTKGVEGMQGAVNRAEEMVAQKGYKMLGQFDNKDNYMAHYYTTAEEIFADLPSIDAFVAGIGTGGTISGTGKRLKELSPKIEIVGVEPTESAIIEGGKPAPHGIQGIGANFIPINYKSEFVDVVENVTAEESSKYTKRFAEEESVLLGISSGASIAVAVRVARRLGEGKSVVVVAPDGGEKYISMNLFK